VPCTSFGGSTCCFSATLGSLFALVANWKAEFPGSEGSALKLDAGAYVFWRYKINGSDVWRPWDASAAVKFTASSTIVSIQAWTRCGLVKEFSFSVALYLHSARSSVCPSFPSMWQQVDSSGKATASSSASMTTIDASSDFASLLFSYSGVTQAVTTPNTVKTGFKSVGCTIKVTDALTSFSSVLGKALPLTMNPTSGAVSQSFGVELVSFSSSTKVRAECTFTFHPNEIATTDANFDEVETCSYDFRVSQCSASTVTQGQCSVLRCPWWAGLGAYEVCKGVVFTASSCTVTVRKAAATCCTDCTKGTALACTTIAGVPATASDPIGRCEIVNKPQVILILGDHGHRPFGIEDSSSTTEAKWTSWTTMAIPLGISAILAFVALAAAKYRRMAKDRDQRAEVDDRYLALVD